MTVAKRAPDPLFHLALGGVCLAVMLASCLLRVRSDVAVGIPGWGNLPETCWLRGTTGMPCPGCGLTRSFISFAHGDLAAAWRFNPVGPLFFVLVAIQVPYRVWQYLRIRRGSGEFQLPLWEWLPFYAVLGLLVGQWLIRLTPVASWAGL